LTIHWRRRQPARLVGLARVDLHQQIAFAHRLPGIDQHFDDATGDLRRQRRLIDRLDQRLGGQRQLNRMRLDDDRRQSASACTAREAAAATLASSACHQKIGVRGRSSCV
jgi:hypothetical protein